MSNSPFLNSVRKFCRVKHYSLKTEKAYLHWIKRFIFFHKKQHPLKMAEPEVKQFLTYIAQVLKVSPTTQNQALCALSFMYKTVLDKPLVDMRFQYAKTPQRVPQVLNHEEAMNVISHLKGIHQLIGALMYGGGFRISEVLRLRIKDFDFTRHTIYIFRSKGQKDRVTLFPEALHQKVLERIEQGHDIRVVQELLGHDDVKTTQIYTHVLGKHKSGAISPLDS